MIKRSKINRPFHRRKLYVLKIRLLMLLRVNLKHENFPREILQVLVSWWTPKVWRWNVNLLAGVPRSSCWSTDSRSLQVNNCLQSYIINLLFYLLKRLYQNKVQKEGPGDRGWVWEGSPVHWMKPSQKNWNASRSSRHVHLWLKDSSQKFTMQNI